MSERERNERLCQIEAAMKDMGKRRELEEAAAKAVTRAKSRMIMGKGGRGDCFFATPVMSLHYAPNWTIATACTDGATIWYNPAFWLGLSGPEQLGVLAHESFHVVLKHHCRLGSRNLDKANIAMDLVINHLLEKNGYRLPAGAVVAGKGDFAHVPTDKAWEYVYTLLPDPPKRGGQGGGGQGPLGNDPGMCGGVKKPGDGSPAALQQAEGEAEQLATMAQYMAAQRGTVPADIARLVGATLESKVPWQDELAEFVMKKAADDYNWLSPDRRLIAAGLYLPGLDSDELGDLVFLMDTSGSISHRVLTRFAAEALAIVAAYKVKVTILWHDSDVAGVQVWEPEMGEYNLEPRGGGGTSHVPCFRWIEDNQVDPACVIAFTDMYTEFPAVPPDYPVLWAHVGAGVEPPFGRRLQIDTQGW